MFISFEGIDGSGKSTQLLYLKEWLEERQKKVVTVREPGATVLSESIREILLNNRNNITSTAELLLFSAARTQLVESVIRPTLERGDFVLCDRYVDSTTAYQGYGRKLDLKEVELCNSLATQGVLPTVTFFIDVPYDEAQLRMQFHPGASEPDRMEKSGRDFYERVREGYLAIAEREPSRFVIVNGVQARADIHAEIVEEMSSRLSLTRPYP